VEATSWAVHIPTVCKQAAALAEAALRERPSHLAYPRRGAPGRTRRPPRGAELLFQVLTEREERASVAVASAPFSEWGQTFADPRLAAAVVDRLTFRARIIETGNESYRLRVTSAARGVHHHFLGRYSLGGLRAQREGRSAPARGRAPPDATGRRAGPAALHYSRSCRPGGGPQARSDGAALVRRVRGRPGPETDALADGLAAPGPRTAGLSECVIETARSCRRCAEPPNGVLSRVGSVRGTGP
jgi:hypothetical protein